MKENGVSSSYSNSHEDSTTTSSSKLLEKSQIIQRLNELTSIQFIKNICFIL